MTTFTYFQLDDNQVLTIEKQASANKYPDNFVGVGKTTLPFPDRTHHRLHDPDAPNYQRGLHHRITFTPEGELNSDGAYTAGTFTHVYTIYTDGIVQGFFQDVSNTWRVGYLPKGAYDESAFTVPVPFQILTRANQLLNIGLLYQLCIGAEVGLGFENLHHANDVFRAIQQATSTDANDKGRKLFLQEHNVHVNPRTKRTTTTLTDAEQEAVVSRWQAKIDHVGEDYPSLTSWIVEQASNLHLQTSNTTSAIAYDEALRGFFGRAKLPSVLSAAIRVVQAEFRHQDFPIMSKETISYFEINMIKANMDSAEGSAMPDSAPFGWDLDGRVIGKTPADSRKKVTLFYGE